MQEWHKDWYLLRFSQNHWRKLLSVLGDSNVEFCCPMIHSGRLRKDKKQCIRHSVHPAFEGYVFVHFNPEQIPVAVFRRIPGAVDFVRFGGDMQRISAQTIRALRCAEARIIRSDSCVYECIGVDEADVAKIIEIYDTTSPLERASKLMTLIHKSNIRKERKDAA